MLIGTCGFRITSGSKLQSNCKNAEGDMYNIDKTIQKKNHLKPIGNNRIPISTQRQLKKSFPRAHSVVNDLWYTSDTSNSQKL